MVEQLLYDSGNPEGAAYGTATAVANGRSSVAGRNDAGIAAGDGHSTDLHRVGGICRERRY